MQTNPDDRKVVGRAKEAPHLLQLPCDQGAKNRVTRGGGPEVATDPVLPGIVKSSTGRVQAHLHELGECDSPVLLNQIFDLLANC